MGSERLVVRPGSGPPLGDLHVRKHLAPLGLERNAAGPKPDARVDHLPDAPRASFHAGDLGGGPTCVESLCGPAEPVPYS